MTTQDFTTHSQAIRLKSLGFNEPCITSFDTEGRLRNPYLRVDFPNSEYDFSKEYLEEAEHFVTNDSINPESGFVPAPLIQQAIRFFREKYNVYSFVYVFDGGFSYETYIRGVAENSMEHGDEFDTYLAAEIACVDNMIKVATYFAAKETVQGENNDVDNQAVI